MPFANWSNLFNRLEFVNFNVDKMTRQFEKVGSYHFKLFEITVTNIR